MSLLCSVVVTPRWFGALSKYSRKSSKWFDYWFLTHSNKPLLQSSVLFLPSVSLPIQFHVPCVPFIQSLPTIVHGPFAIVFLFFVIVLLACAPYVPFVKLVLKESTTSKIQQIAGIIVGQSAIVCVSSTIKLFAGTDYLTIVYSVPLAIFYLWCLSMLYSRAATKFEESRTLSSTATILALPLPGGRHKASMLPFYSTFCMPYVSLHLL